MPLLRIPPNMSNNSGTLAEIQRTASLLAGTPANVPLNTYDLKNPMSLMTASPTFKMPGVSSVDPSFAPAFQPRIGDTGTSFGPSTGIAPGFQPTLDKEELATGVEAEKKRLKGERNKKLGFMLFALGGALRGDKNFVQNTMQIRTLQEGKEKEDKKKKTFQDYLKKLPDGSYKDLVKAMGYDNLDKLLLESYKTQTKKLTVGDYKAYLAEKTLRGIPFTQQDQQLSDYLQNLDPLEKFTNTLVEQQLAGLGIGGAVGSTPDPSGLVEFPSLEAAKQAGLKSGDQFRGTDGNVYRLP